MQLHNAAISTSVLLCMQLGSAGSLTHLSMPGCKPFGVYYAELMSAAEQWAIMRHAYSLPACIL